MVDADGQDADPERRQREPHEREAGVEHEHLQKQRHVLHHLHVHARDAAQHATRDTDSTPNRMPSASAMTSASAEMPTVVPNADRMSGQRWNSASHL